MPSAEENMHLLWLLLQQKMENSQLPGIDWAPVATALGLEQPKAASVRWSRLKQDLTTNGIPTSTAEDGAAKVTKKAAKPKTKNPTEKVAKGEKSEKAKKITKKRKLEEVEEIEEVADGVDHTEDAGGEAANGAAGKEDENDNAGVGFEEVE